MQHDVHDKQVKLGAARTMPDSITDAFFSRNEHWEFAHMHPRHALSFFRLRSMMRIAQKIRPLCESGIARFAAHNASQRFYFRENAFAGKRLQ